MKADGINEGTIGVMDMNLQRIVIRPAGEPDENQELSIVQDGEWVPYRHKTMRELVDEATAMLTDASASIEAAMDILEQINEQG